MVRTRRRKIHDDDATGLDGNDSGDRLLPNNNIGIAPFLVLPAQKALTIDVSIARYEEVPPVSAILSILHVPLCDNQHKRGYSAF
jgi:hypothetical protein